jgi:hypothetical protein
LFELKLAHIATNSFAGQFGRERQRWGWGPSIFWEGRGEEESEGTSGFGFESLIPEITYLWFLGSKFCILHDWKW